MHTVYFSFQISSNPCSQISIYDILNCDTVIHFLIQVLLFLKNKFHPFST